MSGDLQGLAAPVELQFCRERVVRQDRSAGGTGRVGVSLGAILGKETEMDGPRRAGRPFLQAGTEAVHPSNSAA